MFLRSDPQRNEMNRKEKGVWENKERAKVTVFFNEMEETDQLDLEPIVKLVRDIAKVSRANAVLY